MTERTIIEAAARLRRHGEPYLVATVVCVQGSAYRQPGARMLLTRFRWIAGSVSGGCLEGDISSKGWWRTHDGSPLVVRYDSRVPGHVDDDDVRAAFGLDCDGVVDVMLERAGAAAPTGRIDPLELAYECTRTQRRAAVATVFRSDLAGVPIGARLAMRAGDEPFGDALPEPIRDALATEARAAIERGSSTTRTIRTAAGEVEACIEALLPPPRLFVIGSGHDAVPVVDAARALGWDVVVATARPRVSISQRFTHADEILVATPAEIAARIDDCDRAAAIVMGHDDELDREHLGALVASRARYIGLLGPRTRTTRMLGELGHADGDARIHAPIGLDLGAETPQELALAAVAEIQAALARVRHSRSPSRVARLVLDIDP